MKKRVLQFIGSFNEGGSERQAISLAAMLKQDESFEVFVATLNREGALARDAESVAGGEVVEFPLTSFYDANFVRQVRRCAKYLRDSEIDVIHTHDFYTNVFGMAAARLAGTNALICSKRETNGMRTAAQKFVEQAVFAGARKIVANAQAVRDHLEKSGVSAEKIEIIHNGVDLSRFSSPVDRVAALSRFDLPTEEGIRFVVTVANLRHDVKNIPMLLRAARRVLARIPRAHFVVAGEGELESVLSDMAAELGVAGNLHFIGRCADVPALLSVADACVLTSRAEGFSNSILEYMAAGKPVVATSVGGASEAVVDGETGFLVTSDDDETMAAKLVEILGDKERAEAMGAKGKRRIAENFSARSQLAKTLKLYNELLEK